MKAIFPLSLALLAAGLGLAGCGSFASRSDQKAAVYDALPARTQQRLQRGTVRVGDTPEMVYIAMGNPDTKTDVPDAAGYQSVWIYKNYFQRGGDRKQTGWSKVLVPEIRDQGDKVIQSSVSQDVSRPESTDDIRVAFVGGVVSSVAELQL